MKKALAAILLMVYSVATSGVVLHHHYCMNELASTELFSSSTKYCGKCGMHTDNSEGCCRDEVKVLKLEQDQQKAPTVSVEIAAPAAPDQLVSDCLHAPVIQEAIARITPRHSPPLLPHNDTYLRLRVFRI